ncbi:UNVERIFIED_ORG: hypothetical protein BCL66_105244 [Martelella mediterranea]
MAVQEINTELLAEARNVSEAAKQGMAWTESPESRERMGERLASVSKELRRGAVTASRLIDAVERPMAVAVFGASQVGKSHLISVLARSNDELFATFDGVDEPVSYINRINIDKGTESTGVVTRFTMRKAPAPSGFPVCLRLLGHADIIKILANAYFLDGKPRDLAERNEIEAHIEPYRDMAGSPANNGLSIEDIWDLEEYCKEYLDNSPLTPKLAPFWRVAARCFSYLTIEQLGDFLSILWGGQKAVSKLYVDLVSGLQSLDFPSEAFVPLDVIDATDSTIISIVTVDGLNDLASGSDQMIEIATHSGKRTSLPRSSVAALTAELWITIKDKPWDFLDHTDLLDFPGYRSRGLEAGDIDLDDADGPRGIARFLSEHPDQTLKQLLLRGKVEYLFQRYVAEQEITSMLLCAKDSNLDVLQLPEVVARWIGTTHGSKPADRQGKDILLFFIFTMFDKHFEQKAGDDLHGLGRRFVGRMESSLLHPYGKNPDSWVQNWGPGKPFDNCFLMRNPNVHNDSIFVLDENHREEKLRPDKADFINRLKAAFSETPEVRAHFRDPKQAFDQMMALNDGGARHIAENLSPVCDPAIKERQIAFRLSQLRHRLRNALEPYFVPTDSRERLAERLKVADQVIEDIYRCESLGRFGSFLSGLMLDTEALADRLSEVNLNRSVETAHAATQPTAAVATTPRPRPGGDGPRPRPGRAPAEAPAAVATENNGLKERETLMGEAAVGELETRLGDAAANPHFAALVGMSTDTLGEIARELTTAAERVELARRVADTITRVAFVDRRDQMIEKATVAAEQVTNHFIADFGTSLLDPEERAIVELEGGSRPAFQQRPTTFDASGIGPVPDSFAQRYVDDWVHAFYGAVEKNALSDSGLTIDPALNETLSNILDMLKPGQSTDREY